MTYYRAMYTIAETPIFTRYVADYWTEKERGEFCVWLANNPSLEMSSPVLAGTEKYECSCPGKASAVVHGLFITTCLMMAPFGC